MLLENATTMRYPFNEGLNISPC